MNAGVVLAGDVVPCGSTESPLKLQRRTRRFLICAAKAHPNLSRKPRRRDEPGRFSRMDNQRVNRTTALAVLFATAVFQLTAAETKRETMDRRVRAAIAGFQGTVRLYAKNLDTGETYGIGENEKVRTSCPSWWRYSAQSPPAVRIGMRA